METTEAKAIKDDVLEPYRNEFREKLKHSRCLLSYWSETKQLPKRSPVGKCDRFSKLEY
ncbi:hypothetical protein [Nostoc sp. 'Peltigera membranacea cyanobiont' 210A]|uniref:hypothetical protein n=1 Tax=Nostoc sp. 'Peltigera membranacea cyanobiont' 210A TaxID=2014529 RepID=UPI001CB9D0D8|nr:hypothetical protein [Nostoc sp. 'Peltigera membranacea cyanobiont' 210A]